MRKFLTICFSVIMCFSLSACAVRSSDDDYVPRVTATTAAETTTAAVETTTEEVTTTVHTEEFTFLVPSGSNVTVNGTNLDSSYVKGTGVPEEVQYSCAFVDSIPEYTYYVGNFEPDGISVSGSDADGNALVFSVDDHAYTGVSSADQEFINSVSDIASAGLNAWGLYFINFSDLKPYVLYSSELYGMIFGSAEYNWINNTFYNYEYVTGYNYSTFELSNYVTYGENCFAVDVKYKLDVTFSDPSVADDNQKLDATMIWVNDGSGWQISDIYYTPEINEFPEVEGIEFVSINEKTYTGTMMIISDPSRVFTGTIDNLGSATGLKINAVLEQYNSEGVSVVAGVNGGDFVDTGTYIYTGTPTGLVISNGEVVYCEDYSASYRLVGLTNENKLIFGVYTADEAIAAGVRDSVHCDRESGPFLVEDGQVYSDIPDPSEYGAGKNSRTAIGQRADGSIILVCVNGRQANSLGATFYDLADLMIKYGAVTAAAVDGGSSSQMGLKYSDGTYKYINHPYTPAYGPRACPTFWLVK